MRVKSLYNKFAKEYVSESHRLTFSKEYLMLQIDFKQNQKVCYLMLSDSHQTPVLVDAKYSAITSGKIPNNCQIASADIFRLFSIEPKVWKDEPDFWEDLYNSKEKALKLYKKEVI